MCKQIEDEKDNGPWGWKEKESHHLVQHFNISHLLRLQHSLSLLRERLNGKMVLNSILKFNYLLKEYLHKIYKIVVACYRYLSWESPR